MTQRHAALATLGLVAILAIAAAAWYFWRPSRALQSAAQPPVLAKAVRGSTAPEFEVATTAGLFDLDKATKPVFLEVFATWCPHCQREAAVIDRLYAKYGARVAFIGVSGSNTAMDGTSNASVNDVIAWKQRFNVRYPVAYDPLQNVADLYLQGGFPTLVVIDKAKKITYLDSGEIPYETLAAAIERIL